MQGKIIEYYIQNNFAVNDKNNHFHLYKVLFTQFSPQMYLKFFCLVNPNIEKNVTLFSANFPPPSNKRII